MSEDIKAKSLNIENLVDYQKDTVVSREVIKKELGTVTFFAFDKGQGLSEHSAPFDAMVQVIDGEAEITISGNKNIVKKGEIVKILFAVSGDENDIKYSARILEIVSSRDNIRCPGDKKAASLLYRNKKTVFGSA